MYQAVQLAEFLLYVSGKRGICCGISARKIQHGDAWPGCTFYFLDLVINLFELTHVSPVQHDLCAESGRLDRKGVADAIACAGDQDDAATQ